MVTLLITFFCGALQGAEDLDQRRQAHQKNLSTAMLMLENSWIKIDILLLRAKIDCLKNEIGIDGEGQDLLKRWHDLERGNEPLGIEVYLFTQLKKLEKRKKLEKKENLNEEEQKELKALGEDEELEQIEKLKKDIEANPHYRDIVVEPLEKEKMLIYMYKKLRAKKKSIQHFSKEIKLHFDRLNSEYAKENEFLMDVEAARQAGDAYNQFAPPSMKSILRTVLADAASTASSIFGSPEKVKETIQEIESIALYKKFEDAIYYQLFDFNKKFWKKRKFKGTGIPLTTFKFKQKKEHINYMGDHLGSITILEQAYYEHLQKVTTAFRKISKFEKKKEAIQAHKKKVKVLKKSLDIIENLHPNEIPKERRGAVQKLGKHWKNFKRGKNTQRIHQILANPDPFLFWKKKLTNINPLAKVIVNIKLLIVAMEGVDEDITRIEKRKIFSEKLAKEAPKKLKLLEALYRNYVNLQKEWKTYKNKLAVFSNKPKNQAKLIASLKQENNADYHYFREQLDQLRQIEKKIGEHELIFRDRGYEAYQAQELWKNMEKYIRSSAFNIPGFYKYKQEADILAYNKSEKEVLEDLSKPVTFAKFNEIVGYDDDSGRVRKPKESSAAFSFSFRIEKERKATLEEKEMQFEIKNSWRHTIKNPKDAPHKFYIESQRNSDEYALALTPYYKFKAPKRAFRMHGVPLTKKEGARLLKRDLWTLQSIEGSSENYIITWPMKKVMEEEDLTYDHFGNKKEEESVMGRMASDVFWLVSSTYSLIRKLFVSDKPIPSEDLVPPIRVATRETLKELDVGQNQKSDYAYAYKSTTGGNIQDVKVASSYHNTLLLKIKMANGKKCVSIFTFRKNSWGWLKQKEVATKDEAFSIDLRRHNLVTGHKGYLKVHNYEHHCYNAFLEYDKVLLSTYDSSLAQSVVKYITFSKYKTNVVYLLLEKNKTDGLSTSLYEHALASYDIKTKKFELMIDHVTPPSQHKSPELSINKAGNIVYSCGESQVEWAADLPYKSYYLLKGGGIATLFGLLLFLSGESIRLFYAQKEEKRKNEERKKKQKEKAEEEKKNAGKRRKRKGSFGL